MAILLAHDSEQEPRRKDVSVTGARRFLLPKCLNHLASKPMLAVYGAITSVLPHVGLPMWLLVFLPCRAGGFQEGGGGR